MRMCASYRVKRKSFYRKSERQTFLLISGGVSIHTKLYESKLREMFRKITQELWATDT